LHEFKDLLVEADEKSFPRGVVYEEVATAVKDAEKCASVAQQLIGSKMRTRMRQSGEGKYTSRLTLDELKAFVDQILALPCRVPDLAAVQV
jgi:histone demethylase JARID1